MSKKKETSFNKYDAVSFELNDKVQQGWVLDVQGRFATVELSGDTTYRVPQRHLKKRAWDQRRSEHTEKEYAQFVFLPNDNVEFKGKDGWVQGQITNLASKRASVTLLDGETWRVPYPLLRFIRSHQETTLERKKKLAELVALGLEEIQKHRLKEWIFRFDNSVSRAGVCKYENKLIAVSNIHCLTHNHEVVRDTVLHEIAHALAGPKHYHDEEWVRIAKSIGCTAKVRSDERIERTRYIQTCTSCKWGRRLQRRVRNRKCRSCGKPVSYLPFTEEAWQKFSAVR